MGKISETLEQYTLQYDIALTDEMLEQFEIYTDILLEWNQKMNLTAIVEPKEIAVKHFLDSLLLIKAIQIPAEASIIDVGTGAGFPGIPLKIARPDLRLTLLDSLNKRVLFLSEVSRELKQDNIVIHGRAEQCGHEPKLRERFDFATARAVAALPVLCEYCLPFVKTGGCFAALKGPDAGQEAEASSGVLSKLNSLLSGIKLYNLPPDSKRAIILIKKISQMPTKYPRTSAKISKTPL